MSRRCPGRTCPGDVGEEPSIHPAPLLSFGRDARLRRGPRGDSSVTPASPLVEARAPLQDGTQCRLLCRSTPRRRGRGWDPAGRGCGCGPGAKEAGGHVPWFGLFRCGSSRFVTMPCKTISLGRPEAAGVGRAQLTRSIMKPNDSFRKQNCLQELGSGRRCGTGFRGGGEEWEKKLFFSPRGVKMEALTYRAREGRHKYRESAAFVGASPAELTIQQSGGASVSTSVDLL